MIDSAAIRRTILIAVLVVGGSVAVAGPAAAAARPAVTGLSAGSGPVAGGNRVSVTGSGFAAGVRVLFGSHAGTHVRVQSSHRLTVVAPAHAAGSVHIRVTRSGATSAAHAADRYLYTSAPSRLAWKTFAGADPYRGALSALSCPTTTFCLAVDASGFSLTYDGSTWSEPTPMPVRATRVSCPTATKCTAADGIGNVTTWSSGIWSAPVEVTEVDGSVVATVEAMSCPTTTFCMLFGEGSYETGHDGTWTAPARGLDVFNVSALDCTSSTFCLAVDGSSPGGVTDSWDGTAWHKAATGGDRLADSMSCVSSTFCVTVSEFSEKVFTWTGTSWSSQTLTGSPKLAAVDCATTTSCVAVGPAGQAWKLVGSTWSSVPVGSRDWGAVSCASPTACVAIGSRQYATSFDGSGWTAPRVVVNASGGPTDVTCSSSLFCMLVDESGAAVEYLHGTWKSARPVYVGGQLTAVDCPRSNFCLAVGSSGRTVTWNGSSWAAPVAHAGFGTFADVSCASTTSCVAVSGNHALHWTGSGWRSTTIAHASAVRALDCPSTTYCLAATAGGYAVSWNGHSWSSARRVVTSALSVACGAVHECYVGDSGGEVAALHGAVWSAPYSLGGGSPLDLDCPNTGFCAAAATNLSSDFASTRVPTFRGAAVNLRVAKHQDWQMVAISCPTSHFCVLIDDFSGAVVGSR